MRVVSDDEMTHENEEIHVYRVHLWILGWVYIPGIWFMDFVGRFFGLG